MLVFQVVLVPAEVANVAAELREEAVSNEADIEVPVRVRSCSWMTATSLAMLSAAASMFSSRAAREDFSSSEQVTFAASVIFLE